MPTIKVGHATWGALLKERDNVILMLPPTSRTPHSYGALIRPGKAVDTDRYYVIAIDPIGGGTRSKLGDGLGELVPKYTIRDMVWAQYRLVSGQLHLTRIHSVIGASMGFFQAIEWGIAQPLMMDRRVLIAPAARSDAHLQTVVDAMVATMDLAVDRAKSGKVTHWSLVAHAAPAQWIPWLRSDT